VALKQPEPAILRAAQRGDETAFAWIFQTYRQAIHRYVSRMLNDDLAAEDVTQEVFIRAHRSLSRFDQRSLFTSWLFQIAKNRIVDEHRARARRPSQAVESDERSVVPPSAEPDGETREIVSAIWRSVAALDDRLKNALLLRDVSGLSYREIAEVLEIDIGNVKWRIFKAREAVQNDLALAGLTPSSQGRDASAPPTVAATAS
jgi:RNA polymerase sigma-70 factor, ECF subfamily